MHKGELAILTAIVQHGECDRNQLTVLTGYKKSTRNEYIRRLKEHGFVDGSDTVHATEDGVAALGDSFDPLPTGDALRDYWRNRLGGGIRAIFEYLEEYGTDTVARDEIGEAVGQKRSTRNEYIRRLAAQKLVVVNSDGIALSPTLFD